MSDFVAKPDSSRSFTPPERYPTRSGPVAPAVSQPKASAASATKSPSLVTPAPTSSDIAKRAHEIYIQKGSKQGECKANWQQAELELRMQTESGGYPERNEVQTVGRADAIPGAKGNVPAKPCNTPDKESTSGGKQTVPPTAQPQKA